MDAEMRAALEDDIHLQLFQYLLPQSLGERTGIGTAAGTSLGPGEGLDPSSPINLFFVIPFFADDLQHLSLPDQSASPQGQSRHARAEDPVVQNPDDGAAQGTATAGPTFSSEETPIDPHSRGPPPDWPLPSTIQQLWDQVQQTCAKSETKWQTFMNASLKNQTAQLDVLQRMEHSMTTIAKGMETTCRGMETMSGHLVDIMEALQKQDLLTSPPPQQNQVGEPAPVGRGELPTHALQELLGDAGGEGSSPADHRQQPAHACSTGPVVTGGQRLTIACQLRPCACKSQPKKCNKSGQ